MAIYNPSQLYGGFSFQMDPTPLVNYMMKRQAQEQASEQARDKYYRNLVQGATDKNVRTIDIPVFNKAIKNYQDFYIQNSAELSSGRNPEIRMKAEELAKLPYNIMNRSAQQKAVEEKIGAAEIADKKLKQKWTPLTQRKFSKSTNPVYSIDESTGQITENPNYEFFNTSLIETTPDDINFPDYWSKKKGQLAVKETKTPIKTEKDPNDPLKDITSYQISVPKEEMLRFGNDLGYDYDNNNDVQYNFLRGKEFNEKKATFSPQQFNDINETFKSAYDRDIEPGNSKELYVGYALNTIAPSRIEKGEPVINATRQMKERERIQKERDAKIIAARKNAQGAGIDVNTLKTGFESFSGTIKPGVSVNQNGEWVDDKGVKLGNQKIRVAKAKLPPDIIKVMNQNAGSNSKYIEDATIYIENGKPIKAENEFGGTIKRDDVLDQSIEKALKEKKLGKPTSFVPSMGQKIGGEMVSENINDKFNLSI